MHWAVLASTTLLLTSIWAPVAGAQAGEAQDCSPAIMFDSAEGLFQIESDASRPTHFDAGGMGTSASKPHRSPDERSIGFVRYAADSGVGPELWLMDGDGGNPRRLLTEMTADQPAWSPDGTRIAFTSDLDGDQELYLMDRDGRNLRQLTRNDVWDDYPAWSPNGEQIAFGSLRDGSFDVFVMGSDGSDIRQLTFHLATDFRPSWSPDGEWIAFSSTRADETAMRTSNYDIYLMRPDGSDVRRITHHQLSALRPSWSPLGTEIVYQVGGGAEDGSDWEIYAVDVSEGPPRRLTNNAIRDAHPDWNTFQLACRVP